MADKIRAMVVFGTRPAFGAGTTEQQASERITAALRWRFIRAGAPPDDFLPGN